MTQKFRPRVEGVACIMDLNSHAKSWVYMWLVRDEIIDSLRMFVLIRRC